jgi:hypothetical protein
VLIETVAIAAPAAIDTEYCRQLFPGLIAAFDAAAKPKLVQEQLQLAALTR